MPKSLLTSAGLACLFLLLPPTSASTSAIELVIDLGDQDSQIVVDQKDEAEDDDDDDDPAEDDDDDDDDLPPNRPITCEGAKKVLKRAGFKNVGVRSCIGKAFRLTGSRNGYDVEIVVSRFGRILATRRR